MKKILSLTLAVIFAFALAGAVFADYPKSESYFYDGAGIISDEAKAEIKSVNDKLFVDRGMRIAVCVVENTGDVPANTYARGVFGEWKVNGVLLLIVKSTEYYYAVQSSGISETLTDEKLSGILNTSLEADFAAGNYSAGVSATVKAISSFITENVKTDDTSAPASTADNSGNSGGSKVGSFFKVLGIIVLILVILAAAGYGLLVYLERKQEQQRRFEREERRRRLAESGRGNYYGDPRRAGRDPRPLRPPQGDRRPAPQRPQATRVAYPEADAYNRINSRPQNAQRRPAQTAAKRPPVRGQRVDFDKEYFTGSLDDDFVDPTATREFTRH